MLGESKQAPWCGRWHAEPDGANKEMQQGRAK